MPSTSVAPKSVAGRPWVLIVTAYGPLALALTVQVQVHSAPSGIVLELKPNAATVLFVQVWPLGQSESDVQLQLIQ